MAELVVTQDELALRRRARRRLVGAVAIALTVVVVLPMLFDSEPKPLGPEVDIRIPAHDSSFTATPELAPPVKSVPDSVLPAPKPAEPTHSAVVSAPRNQSLASEMPAKPELSSPKAIPASEPAKPAPEKKADSKPEPKPPLKADATFASQGYFLQLGAFGNEANARQLQSKAEAAGFHVVMVGSNGQFRVRVGPIPQHTRALEVQAKLKAKGFSPVLLGP